MSGLGRGGAPGQMQKILSDWVLLNSDNVFFLVDEEREDPIYLTTLYHY